MITNAMKSDNIVKYKKDGMYIVYSVSRNMYTISTDKYQIQWDINKDVMELYDTRPNSLGAVIYIMSLYTKFNMNMLATLQNPHESPAMLEIVCASTSHINHQVDRLMNLKVFL